MNVCSWCSRSIAADQRSVMRATGNDAGYSMLHWDCFVLAVVVTESME